MKLRCKPGDIAIYIYPSINLGKLFSVIGPGEYEDHWIVESLSGPALGDMGWAMRGNCADSKLRPINGDVQPEEIGEENEAMA